MKNCVNFNSPDVVKLAGELNVSPAVAAAKIGLYQDKNGLDKFPTVDELQSSNKVNYQKNQTNSNEGIIASEKTIRDLAAKIADRIGMKVVFESDRSKDYKGKIENNVAYVNLAYATLDTPIHEILGHPIIRAIKNKQLVTKRQQWNFNKPFFNDQTTKNNTGKTITHEGHIYEVYELKKFSNTTYKAINFKRNEEIELSEKEFNDIVNQSQLYQNLLKELEYGKGKEVLDRIKRDYTNKTDKYDPFEGEKISDEEYNNIQTEEVKTDSDEYLWRDFYEKRIGDKVYTIQKGEDANPNSARVYTLPTYSLEEQQEETIVELLGLMTAEKLDNVKDGKLISLLKRLLKEMKAFIRNLINQKEIEIDKLPDNMTLNDLADVLAYSNSKLILPGYEVEYTTPDNEKFKTYQEASNHISDLAKSVEDVDLDNIQVEKNESKFPQDFYKFNGKQFTDIDNKVIRKNENGKWQIEQDFGGDLGIRWVTIDSQDAFERYNEKYGRNNSILGFIEKNKEYEQSKEIIEEWKKVNNIQYNPEEIYSRGQEFSSVVGAYSSFDVNLMMQNLLSHIEDNEKAGGKFAISAYTKPIDKQIGHLEGGGGKIKFKLYPQSNDILWAANTDVYSGSVWDASEKVNKDKKSELLGVSYTKYPSLSNVNTVQPNLASIVDDLNHHHNELGISLTGNNFRLEYDEDIPYTTKKIIDGINKILDQKYGKLVKPEIKTKKLTFEESKELKNLQELSEQSTHLPEHLDKEDLFTKKDQQRLNELMSLKGVQPTQTNETLKESIDSVKDNLITAENYGYHYEGNTDGEEGGWWQITIDNNYLPNTGFDTEQEAIDYIKNINKNKPKKEYNSQALINSKISALKEVAKKQPRSLIRSEVKPINSYNNINYAPTPDLFDVDEFPFQKIPSKDLSKFESDENESIFSESVKEPVKVKEDNFEVNKKLLFGNETDTNRSFTAKEVLQNIIDFDLNLSDAGTNLVFKAMNILNLAKTRVKIISQERFDKLTKNSEGEGTAVMAYNYDNGNVIYMTENSLKMFNKEQILESFIHEVAHNLSIKALINPVTFEEHEFHDLIFKAFEQYEHLGKTLNGSGSYGFTNEKEFVAELYSNVEFRKEIQDLDKGFWKNFIDGVRLLFGLKRTSDNNELISSILLIESIEKFIENNTTADESVFKNDYSNSFNNVLFKKINDVKDADTYELETIDKKAEHLVNKAKSKVAELINRTKKSDKEKAGEFLEEFKKLEKELETLSSLNKWKAITGYMVSFKSAIDKLNDSLENKFKVKEVTFNGVKYIKVKNLDAFKSEKGEFIIPEDQKSKVDKDFFEANNFIVDSNLYNDIENEGIKAFSNKDYLELANNYDEYLASYDLLEDIKKLIGDTVKDSTLSREDKLEIKEIKNQIIGLSEPHKELTDRIKDLRKDSAIKLFADPSNNKKVTAKWRNKLSLEYNKLKNPTQSRDEWIGYHMSNTHAEEIKKDLEDAARKIIENPYTDISSYVKNWMDLLNTNSPLINMIANIVGKMRDSILKEITAVNFKISDVFDEYSKFNNSTSMSKKYGNLVELNESEDRYYLKGKYSIKFKEEYNKMLSKIKDEIYSKYKPFAVQYFNLSSVNNDEKTISLRKTGSHDIIENEELMISVNGIRTGTIVKVNNIITFSEFSKLSDSRKDDFARAIGNYKNYEDFLKSNDYAKKDSKKSLEHPEVYNFINGNESMDIISYTKEKDSKEDYEKFKEKNKIYKDWIKENTVIDEFGNKKPHSKYLNKPLNPAEEKALDFFRTQTKSNHELNYKGRGGLYSTFFGAEYYKLPSKTKSNKERTLEGDLKGQVKDTWTDLKENKVDDINYGEAFDSKGGQLQRVKINFRGKLDSKDQSLDLFTVYRAEEANAISFKHRSANENKLKLFLDIAKNKDYKTKSLVTRKWAMNIFAKEEVQGQTFSGEKSNEYARIQGILETALYDITAYNEETLFGKMDANKLTSKVNSMAAFVGMTLNIGSGAVNFLNGQTMMAMLRIGGNYINKSNLSKSEVDYVANLPEIMADIGRPVKKSFDNQMLNMFDIIGGMHINKQDFMNNSTVKEMMSLHNANFINESVEHGLNCILTRAVLRSIPVMNKNHKYIDKEGKETTEDNAASIFDMLYLDKDGILKTKEYFTYSKYNLVDDYHKTGKQSINYLLKKNVENLYGVYDSNMKAEINKRWYGKLLMVFKSFFLSQMEYRYKGITTSRKSKDELDDEDLTFNNAEQEFTEGIYTTAIRTFYPLLRHLNLQMVKENFQNLSDSEKANLKQVFFEVSMTAILLPLLGAMMAANAGDDDDELYFLLFAFRRLESEMSQFRNIAELNRMISNPIAANRFLQNGFTVVNDIFSPINFTPEGNESYFDWLSENSKDENILLNHAFKLAPGKSLFMNTYKQRYSLIDK